MFTLILAEIESSKAIINRVGRYDNDLPFGMNSDQNVSFIDNISFNRFTKISDYRNKLNAITLKIEDNLTTELHKQKKNQRLLFLRKMKSKLSEIDRLFHNDEQRNIYTHYLKKELRINDKIISENYQGDVAKEEISEFMSSQWTSINWLMMVIDDLIEETKDSLNTPKIKYNTRLLILMVYYLEKHAVLHLIKISQDNTKKGILLSALFSRDKDSIRKYLKYVTVKNEIINLLNVNDLEKIKPVFEQSGMSLIVDDIQSEIDQLSKVDNTG